VTENQQAAQLLQQLWQRIGFKVNLETLEQTAFIAGAATGNYQTMLFRQFSAPDPDSEYHWWTSQNAMPKGQIGLNFARIKNPDLDAAIDEGRVSNDPAVRKQAYARVAKIFGTEVPYLWLNHVQWAIVADNDIRDLLNTTLPGGQPALPALAGVHRLTYAWIER
jgi:ABC-type transport system substrate-binding protein